MSSRAWKDRSTAGNQWRARTALSDAGYCGSRSGSGVRLEAEHQIQIDFRSILHRKERSEHAIGCRLYSYLSKLGKTFVTTNYDEWLDEEIVPPTTDVGDEAGGSVDVP